MHTLKNSFLIFLRFLWLGSFCFGGPAAHIALFQREFVEKRGWLTPSEFGHTLALVQFLPGPSSSQLGFAIGMHRGGLAGAFAAFIGFTLPSALIMFGLALGVMQSGASTNTLLQAILLGLKWFAVVVVLDAVVGMAKTYCTTLITRQIALLMLFFTLLTSLMSLLGLAIAAALGVILISRSLKSASANHVLTNPAKAPSKTPSARWSLLWLTPFLLIPLLWLFDSDMAKLANGFFISGSLVFGGGHVVLPLLQEQFANLISTDALVTGYAIAQAMPGPLFSLATYVGVIVMPEHKVLAALIGTIMIFVPSFFMVLAVQPLWAKLAGNTRIQAAVMGINAAVVGLLFAIFLQPMLAGALGWPNLSANTFAIAGLLALGFVALRWLKLPVLVLLIIMILCAILAMNLGIA